MQTAFAYARVSTKEQAARENSIPAQFKRIEEYCNKNDIKIVRRYFDAESAYRDEKRTQFYQMIDEAVKEYPTYIITDDSSRFARQKNVAVEVKTKLRKFGINVRFSNEPYIDPNTIAGLWNEGIQELINQTSSMQTAFHVLKGMSYNIQNRDPETGWCYKNGGIAAFGYDRKHLIVGENSKGKVLKAIWVIDEETAPIVREILIDWRINKKMSYCEIRDELNKRNIKTKKGSNWATASVAELFKKHKIMTYAGYAVWNKTNTKIKSRGLKDESEWIVVENAHEAIITEEEMNKLIDFQKLSRKGAPAGRTKGSSFLFTGYNYEKEKLFICKKCGHAMVGDQNHNFDYYKYKCGGRKNKGISVCDSNVKIDKEWLENLIIDEITKKYTSPESLDRMIKEIDKSVNSNNIGIDREINKHKKELEKIDIEIKRLVNSIKSGIDPELIKDEINKSKEEALKLKERIEELQKSYSSKTSINKDELRLFLSNFHMLFESADQEQKRELLRTFIRKIELDPDNEEITVEFYDNSSLQSIRKGEPYHK